jgi:hypothetical protein
MSTPNYVKLKNAGDAIVVHCTEARLNTRGKWPEVEFVGTDAKTHRPVVVSVPQKSAERQMERIGLTLDQCAGLSLGISRGTNPEMPDKPYWNLAVVGEMGAPKPNPVKPLPQPASYLPDHVVTGYAPETPPPSDADAPEYAAARVPDDAKAFSDPLYEDITLWVLQHIAPMYNRYEVGPTPEAVAAMVATLFIQHNRGR